MQIVKMMLTGSNAEQPWWQAETVGTSDGAVKGFGLS